jgi:hypothetical protein
MESTEIKKILMKDDKHEVLVKLKTPSPPSSSPPPTSPHISS